MLNTKYPFYFEVKIYDGEKYHEEGGFSYADDWDDAAHQLKNAYSDELITMYIEMFDTYSLCFKKETAQKIKEMIENEY